MKLAVALFVVIVAHCCSSFLFNWGAFSKALAAKRQARYESGGYQPIWFYPQLDSNLKPVPKPPSHPAPPNHGPYPPQPPSHPAPPNHGPYPPQPPSHPAPPNHGPYPPQPPSHPAPPNHGPYPPQPPSHPAPPNHGPYPPPPYPYPPQPHPHPYPSHPVPPPPPPPDHCSVTCGSVPAVTLVRYNRTSTQYGIKANDYFDILWPNKEHSFINLDIVINLNGEGSEVTGTGKVSSGWFAGKSVTTSFSQQRVVSSCEGCGNSIDSLSNISGKAVITIGRKGYDDKWIKCEGIAYTFYSPALTCELLPYTYRTRYIELTKCYGNC